LLQSASPAGCCGYCLRAGAALAPRKRELILELAKFHRQKEKVVVFALIEGKAQVKFWLRQKHLTNSTVMKEL
jgi:hypothetical protein